MSRNLLVAAVGVCVLGLSGCTTIQKWVAGDIINERDSLLKVRDKLQDERDAITKEAGLLAAENSALKKGLSASQIENAKLAALADKVKKALADKEAEKRRLQKLVATVAGVDVRTGEDGSFIVMENRILFAAGKVELEPGAREAIDETVYAYMKQHPDQKVRIDGHTDGVPITHSSWKSNHHLAAMRACAVMDYLVSKGIPAKRIYIAGMGPNTPLVKPPTTTADMPENRRVEVLLIPEAGGGIDALLEGFLKD